MEKILNFTGISSPYEEPIKPDINIKTEDITPEIAVNRIIESLKTRNVIS